ncbi:MAG: hypothetical protein ACK44W_15025 [Planctomycetota bacterium]
MKGTCVRKLLAALVFLTGPAARSDEEVWTLLETGQPQFDRDTYQILIKAAHRLRPLERR